MEQIVQTHQQKERHFRLVSKAFLTFSVFTFLVAAVSASKEVKGTMLHARPSSKAVPTVASTSIYAPTTMQAHTDIEFAAADLHVTEPLHLPSIADAPQTRGKLLAGTALGAFGLLTGFAALARRRKASFDPMSGVSTEPASQFSMMSAVGEGSGLLPRPSMNSPEAPAANYVTLEYQRKQAKALFDYFEEQEAAALQKDTQKLGWTAANEISNGRWVMFGWLVGMMTEYATGVSFVEQIKLTLNNLAILDLD